MVYVSNGVVANLDSFWKNYIWKSLLSTGFPSNPKHLKKSSNIFSDHFLFCFSVMIKSLCIFLNWWNKTLNFAEKTLFFTSIRSALFMFFIFLKHQISILFRILVDTKISPLKTKKKKKLNNSITPFSKLNGNICGDALLVEINSTLVVEFIVFFLLNPTGSFCVPIFYANNIWCWHKHCSLLLLRMLSCFHWISFDLEILQFVYAIYVKPCNTSLDKQLLNTLPHRLCRWSDVRWIVLIFLFKNCFSVKLDLQDLFFLPRLAFQKFSVSSMWNKNFATEKAKTKGHYIIVVLS